MALLHSQTSYDKLQTFNCETFIAVWIFGHNINHLDKKKKKTTATKKKKKKKKKKYLTGNSAFSLKSLLPVNWQ